MIHATIMAGGGGTRFWPRSRQRRPKQFLSLSGELSLLQQALERIEGVVSPERTLVVTSLAHREEAVRQLPGIPADRVIGEPCLRDTAACIGLASALIHREDPDATIVVTPADHVIEPAQEFRRALHAAVNVVEEHPGAFVVIGIPPTFPATGYGYIQRGSEVVQRQGLCVHQVRSFREKPQADAAERMLAEGCYLWNSGIFFWKARTILDALRTRQPKLAEGIERIARAWDTPERERVFRAEYEALPRLSIDYAVMENAAETYAVHAPFAWDDLGSWRALERLHPQDAEGNTILGEHCGIDTRDCLIAADPGTLVATAGLRDLLIVQDGDAILVAQRGDEAAIKRLVEHLKAQGHEKHL